MKLLGISGSVRQISTNTALLSVLAEMAPPGCQIDVFGGIQALPIFTPDAIDAATPQRVQDFAAAVASADGLIISSPEYVRAIPGGLKNAIDWLVPREELVHKPIALVHASHRGDDMLASLRLVLQTVTGHFDEADFLRFPLMSKTPDEVRDVLNTSENAEQIRAFTASFIAYIERCDTYSSLATSSS